MERQIPSPAGRPPGVLALLAIALLGAACAPQDRDPEYAETEPASPYAEAAFDGLRVTSDTARVGDCNSNGFIDWPEVDAADELGSGVAVTPGSDPCRTPGR